MTPLDMPDVNILIGAHVPGHPAHAATTRALSQLTSRPFALSPLVLAGFLRIVTHRRALNPPTPLADALRVVRALVDHPRARVLGPGPQHMALFVALCEAIGATGKLVADAQHAAVAMEHGCHWITTDRDFEAMAVEGLRVTLVGRAGRG